MSTMTAEKPATACPPGVEILGPMTPEFASILTPECVAFVAKLERAFRARRGELLKRRAERQAEIDAGKLPTFLAETKHIRDAEWTVASIPADLADRRVEITGPTDRKMVINALNSGASVFMADFEDSNTPTWENQLTGQFNLRDAVTRSITFTSPEGKNYKLNDKTATLLVRPRGWHLDEKHIRVDGQVISGGIFDFALYFFHNVKPLLARGTGPYFYLPKMESHLEARLWNDIFVMAQAELGIPRGTIRATVLIETILAAFEMDEILYELREHSAGLNCGRWDYLFSAIKVFRHLPGFCFSDRAHLTMTVPFMRAYALLLTKTCHHRNAHAMGGMSAFIPIKNDPVANEAAMAKVRADKEREAGDGMDGTWVAHPGLVSIAKEVFDRHMPGPNQIAKKRDDVTVEASQLIDFGKEIVITEEGLRLNINIAMQYLGSWLAGTGCVPIFNLMEDAATAEISRIQIWQWVRSDRGILQDGREVTLDLVKSLIPEELVKIREYLGEANFAQGKYALAGDMLLEMTAKERPDDFLTLPGYEKL